MNVRRTFLPAALVLGVLVVMSPSHDAGTSLVSGPRVSPLLYAWIAGLALAVVASVILSRLPRGGPSVAGLLIAVSTITVLPSLVELARVVARAESPWRGAWEGLFTVRLAPLFADVNAAGSFFALFAVTAWSMSRSRARSTRWRWMAAALSLATWLTGSRTALAAVVVVLAGLWLMTRPARLAAAAIGLTAVASLIYLVFAPPTRVPQASSGYAWSVRVDMARVALAMSAEHPFFGVGLGRFQRESRHLIPADLPMRFPPAAQGENAHDNFLQVLAELGVVGLAAFLVLIGGPLVSSLRASRRGTAPPELVALTAGLCTFLLTCLTGHPLVTPSVAVTFFVVLGVVAGLSDSKAER